MLSEEIKQWVVLIVDDELDNVQLAEKILTWQGAVVHTARNGREGLAVVNRVQPTFVLLDLSMPVMDGWQMYREMRACPETAHIPVIALTAHAMPGDKDRVIEAGFDGYIAKPFSLRLFLEELRNCIRQINLRRANSTLPAAASRLSARQPTSESQPPQPDDELDELEEPDEPEAKDE